MQLLLTTKQQCKFRLPAATPRYHTSEINDNRSQRTTRVLPSSHAVPEPAEPLSSSEAELRRAVHLKRKMSLGRKKLLPTGSSTYGL